MASIQLQPPTSFDFRDPNSWPRWKRRFEQFCLASGLASEDDVKQISYLMYCMGEDVEETLTSTNISADDRAKFDAVFAKFDEFFKVRKNLLFEQARHCQKPGESVDQFITFLYRLVENCAYGDLRDDMIRDRIVVGIIDQGLSERLQLDAKLTLESAKTLVRQREAVHEQQAILRRFNTDPHSREGNPQGRHRKGTNHRSREASALDVGEDLTPVRPALQRMPFAITKKVITVPSASLSQ